MKNTKENDPANVLRMTIANFLQEEKRGSELLKVLGLPTEGNEHKTLMEVCTARQRNEDEVINEIERLKKGPEFDYPEKIFSWSPELVIRYLEEEHHEYTCSLIRDAEDYGKRAWGVHGIQYPKLNDVKWYVQKIKKKLGVHLHFEEQEFFPIVLGFFEKNGDGVVQTLKKQAEIIEKYQEEMGYLIQRIRELTNHFTPPNDACTTFRLLYFTLQKLDEDLVKHYFLEEQYVLSKLRTKIENSI